MSETLCAVIIGGIIAIAATIPPLIYSHYHWKKDKKLEHLKAERRHLEEQYLHVLPNIPNIPNTPDCMETGDWDIMTRVSLVLPDDIIKELKSLILQADDKQIDWPEIYLRITRSARTSLDEIDKKINELLS